jgi:hypothetical protein
LSHILGREEGLEQAGQRFGRDARTIVRNLDLDEASSPAMRTHLDLARCTARRKCLLGVDDDVEQRLLQQKRIARHARQLGRQRGHDFDSCRGARRCPQTQRSCYDVVGIEPTSCDPP